MQTVVTLVGKQALDAALTARAADAVPRGHAFLGETELGPGAADLFFDGRVENCKDVAALVRRALDGAPIDVVVQPVASRRKTLLVADMDSTMIEQECIDEIADYIGKRAEVSAITERAMRGELDFEAALIERVAMLKGLPEAALQEVYDKRITFTAGGRALIKVMSVLGGAKTALVSGGFTFFTGRVARALGFDHHEANELMIENGRLTGEVARPIRGRAAKQEGLLRFAKRYGVPRALTLAVGDGANDLALLAAAGTGVAYCAKPAVAAAADVRIEHSDLHALIYMQGYQIAQWPR
jgi:phosphoserine phosphatase